MNKWMNKIPLFTGDRKQDPEMLNGLEYLFENLGSELRTPSTEFCVYTLKGKYCLGEYWVNIQYQF